MAKDVLFNWDAALEVLIKPFVFYLRTIGPLITMLEKGLSIC